ncbi:hypothetical protein H4R34_005980 [Dimargaris verticillata]|uniref:Uncharacterized protein n=1 Tax=Dimargaris verticillata TaxID=2761393 RepID=A0A9W8AVY0_9FUNG|nr:hypothetical protein H4R34_005980 [Dimargaris verticillata]
MPQVSRGHMAYNSGYPQAQWQASYGATNPGDSSYPMEGDGMPLAPADGASPAGNSTSGNQTHENGAPTHTNSSHMVPFPGQPRLPMYTGPFYPSMVPPGAPNYGPQPIYYPNQPHPMQYQNNMHRHTPSGSSGGQMGGRGRVGGRGRGSKPFSSHRGGGVNGGSARGGYRPTHYNQRSSPPTSAQ